MAEPSGDIVAVTSVWAEAARVREVSRRSMLKASGVTFAAGGLAAFLAACGGVSSKGSSSGTASDTLTVVSASTTTSFDPDSTGASLVVYPLIYDSLFDVSTPPSYAAATKALENFNPLPALAKSWESTADGLTWTFTLNTSATSMYGNKLSQADVLWSMERHMALKWYSGVFLSRIGVSDIKQLTAVGDNKVQLKLNGPVGRTYFLMMLGSLLMVIYDSTEAKKHTTSADPWATKWLAANGCGYGPYTIKSATPSGSSITFEALPGYYGSVKPIKTVQWVQTTESDSQLELLLRGQAQISDALSPVQDHSVSADASTKTTTVATTGAVSIGFNCSQEIYKEVAFRQGIAYAMPYAEIVNDVYKGQATPAKSVLPSFLLGYTGKYGYSTDIGKAKQLLAPYAGQSVTLQYAAGNAVLQELAVLVQSSLKSAGLSIKLDAMDPATFQTKLTGATLSMWIDNISTALVPDSLYALQLLFPSKPTQILLHYSNPEVDAAVDSLAKTFKSAEQVQFIRTAQKAIMHDVPFLPLAQLPEIVPSAKDVTNIRGHGGNAVWVKNLKFS
jgi:peptide/nickel transport system substrate-binding protein